MNRQQEIKKYYDYGFTPQEIAKELNIEVFLVNTALKEYVKPKQAMPANSLKNKKVFYDWGRGIDNEMPMYEMLYEYGALKINKYVRVFGFSCAAELMRYTKNNILALKKHFGYYNHIPKDALDKINYFSVAIKREVDARDGRECVRCGRELNKDNIRYHKISHPGPMNADNCVTVCAICRAWRLRKHYDVNSSRFTDMNADDFIKWIHTNDPPHAKRKRKYGS